MAYQYQQLTGDNAWAQSHGKLFKQFADYLKTNGLNPSLQLDTVDSIKPTVNQTNLAITSAIGLKAYGALTGNQAYTQTAQTFASTIYRQGLSTNLYSNGIIHQWRASAFHLQLRHVHLMGHSLQPLPGPIPQSEHLPSRCRFHAMLLVHVTSHQRRHPLRERTR